MIAKTLNLELWKLPKILELLSKNLNRYQSVISVVQTSVVASFFTGIQTASRSSLLLVSKFLFSRSWFLENHWAIRNSSSVSWERVVVMVVRIRTRIRAIAVTLIVEIILWFWDIELVRVKDSIRMTVTMETIPFLYRCELLCESSDLLSTEECINGITMDDNFSLTQKCSEGFIKLHYVRIWNTEIALKGNGIIVSRLPMHCYNKVV